MGNCRWKADSSAEFCGFFEPQICPFPWMRFAASRFLRAAILSCSTRFATRIGTVALTVIFLPLIEKRRRRGAILFLSLDKSPATPGSVRPTGREFQRIDFVDADDWLTSTFTERSTPAFCPLSDKAASARSQQCPTGLRDGFRFAASSSESAYVSERISAIPSSTEFSRSDSSFVKSRTFKGSWTRTSNDRALFLFEKWADGQDAAREIALCDAILLRKRENFLHRLRGPVVSRF